MPILFTSFPGWQKIAEADTTGAGTLNIPLNNLNLEQFKPYMIVFSTINNEGAPVTIGLHINDDAVETNYFSTLVSPVLNVQTSATTNTSTILNVADNVEILFVGFLVVNSRTDALLTGMATTWDGANLEIRETSYVYLNLTLPITKLDFISSGSITFGNLSKVQLFKTI
jgi:hypothetical protein